MTELLDTAAGESLKTAYRQASRCLLALDYDGVLHDLVDDISVEGARPTGDTLRLLGALAADPKTNLTIVSGRTREILQDWFQTAPEIDLCAEHGAWRKIDGEWQAQVERFDMSHLVAFLQPYVAQFPGTAIEQKSFGLVFHYRLAADKPAVERALPAIRQGLAELVNTEQIGVFDGSNIIEIKPRSMDKGIMVRSLIDETHPDYVLIAGDDYTDEHMFAAAPEAAYTIHVGDEPTEARYRIGSSHQFVEVLKSLLT